MSDHPLSTANLSQWSGGSGEGSSGSGSSDKSPSEPVTPLTPTTPLTVTLTNSEIWEKSKKFTVYKLVVCQSGKNVTIYRRYNEFRELYELIKKKIRGSGLKLPGRKLFGNNFSPDFIKSRRQGLHEFINRLICDERLINLPEVRLFLGLSRASTDISGSSDHDEEPMEIGTPPSTPTSSPIIDLGLKERTSAKPTDFDFLKVIGKGSFGKVYLAKQKSEGAIFAVKVLQKKMILKRNEKNHIMCERNVLLKNLSHPFLVGLHYSFQSRDKLYFVLDYVNGGELFHHLQKERFFSEPRARFYAAELTSALGYLHVEGIIYRDLKPENILLDSDGHVLLTDFGLCKDGLKERETTTTFCGTPEYLAPEVLRKEAYDRSVDWWCLGAVLYEMLYGLPPFYSRDTTEMYENILHKPVKLRTNISLAARSILEALLQKDKRKRLGSKGDAAEVKKDPFFGTISWPNLESKNIPAPYNPNVKGSLDLKHIDPEFTREPVTASVCRSYGLGGASVPENAFQGFSYADPRLMDLNCN